MKIKVCTSGNWCNENTKLSKERLLDELKKIVQSETLLTIVKNKISSELFHLIFPELKNINILRLSQ